MSEVFNQVKRQRLVSLNHIRSVKNLLSYAPIIDSEMAKELDELKAILKSMNSAPRTSGQVEDALQAI